MDYCVYTNRDLDTGNDKHVRSISTDAKPIP